MQFSHSRGRIKPFATPSGMTAPCALRPSTAASSKRRLRPIAVGPDSNVLIQIRDRLAAQAEALPPRTRWWVCPHLHHRRVPAPQAAGIDAAGDPSAISRASAAMPDAYPDLKRLLPDGPLGSLQHLRDHSDGRPRFRVRLEFAHIFFSPRAAMSGLLSGHLCYFLHEVERAYDRENW